MKLRKSLIVLALAAAASSNALFFWAFIHMLPNAKGLKHCFYEPNYYILVPETFLAITATLVSCYLLYIYGRDGRIEWH